MEMKRLGFHAKNIIAAGYDPVDGVLAVQFKSGVYKYSGVPEVKYVNLCKVPYPDGYYHRSIKGQYPVAEKPEKKAAPEPKPLPLLEQPRKAIEMEVLRPEDGVTFTEEPHAYYLNGKRVPFSLTQILELAGISRQPTEPSEIAARPAAAKRGTKVHEYTLWNDQGELDIDDLKPFPDYYNRVIGWQQFRQDFNFEPDLTTCEIPLVVTVNGMTYAMKLDALGTVDQGGNIALAVIEKKCTADIEASFAIQTAGQAIAFKERAETLQLPLKRYVVQLLATANGAGRFYKCVEHTDRTDERIFLSSLATCYWRYNHGLLKGVA